MGRRGPSESHGMFLMKPPPDGDALTPTTTEQRGKVFAIWSVTANASFLTASSSSCMVSTVWPADLLEQGSHPGEARDGGYAGDEADRWWPRPSSGR